jgi:hypothetical protein
VELKCHSTSIERLRYVLISSVASILETYETAVVRLFLFVSSIPELITLPLEVSKEKESLIVTLFCPFLLYDTTGFKDIEVSLFGSCCD